MKETDVIRKPVPKERVELFISQVFLMADLCGIQKVPELYHAVEIMSRAADTYIFEKTHGPNPARAANEKSRFIAIFKARFRESADYEYPNSVTPVELRIIGQFIEQKLAVKHVDSDFYLAWFFDTFLTKKPSFNPANMKLACSNMCWNAFIYDTREELKEKKEQALQQTEMVDLINRAREVLRLTKDMILKTKIAEALRKYRKNDIIYIEFRRCVLDFEKQLKAEQGKPEG